MGGLLVRDGQVVTDGFARSSNDSTIRGFKGLYKANRVGAVKAVGAIIKNTYRTLMTRGLKGCLVWSEDEETRAYFAGMVASTGWPFLD